MKDPVKNLNFLKYTYGDTTQYFGENPKLYKDAFGLDGHNGWDIVRPWGEHMFAVEGGVICDAGEDTGHGIHVRLISEPNKEGVMRDWVYGHMSYIHVKSGTRVVAGQYLGNIGNTGFVVSNSTGNGFWKVNPYAGTHLHLGVRDVVHDKEGFRYTGYTRGLRCLNYDNGYKGRYDPLPLFATPKALKYAMLANKTNNELYWQMASLLLKLKL